MEYAHLLIPDAPDLAPDPEQVRVFFDGLAKAGMAPLQANITVLELSGRVLAEADPVSGKKPTYPRRRFSKLTEVADIVQKLRDVDDYDVRAEGSGPPPIPPFTFEVEGNEFTDSYAYTVIASLRNIAVSMSSWDGEIPDCSGSGIFGESFQSTTRIGVFQNPHTLEVIKVANAGSARFWIEFEFGKFLFPRIEERLDIIEPAIVEFAKRHFGVGFLQGCRWG